MTRKVLFVDDEASLRRTMALGLSQYGVEADPCENGVTALKRLESYVKNNINLDAVVLDIRLPDIDGIKLAKIIKFKYPEIPIILITGYADRYNMEEIRDLRVSAFLQKPFTPDELSHQFVQVLQREQAAAEPEASPEKIEAKSQSAYMLIRLEDDADFFETHKALYYMDNVLYCDATKGDYDIFLLAQADSMDSLNDMARDKIKTMKGIKSVDFLEVSRPVLDDTTTAVIDAAENALSEEAENFKARRLDQRVCSYLLVDAEREKLDTLYPTLRLDENVIFCDYTTGKYNLVLFVTGSYFDEIDRFIQEKVVGMDGILKVKEYPVISLYEM